MPGSSSIFIDLVSVGIGASDIGMDYSMKDAVVFSVICKRGLLAVSDVKRSCPG